MSAHPDPTEMIIGMHWELADWIGTNAPPKVFDRFSEIFHDEFTAVTTAGQIVDRDTLLAGVWAVRNMLPGLEIEVSDVVELVRAGDLVVLRFAAENRHGTARTPRIATATMVLTESGYQLRALHETAASPAEVEAPSVAQIRHSMGLAGESAVE